jgi:spermidine synthase
MGQKRGNSSDKVFYLTRIADNNLRHRASDGCHDFRMTYLLVFLSGFCALVFQVLWMKQLALLFGNTSHAAGVTLAAFFAGLAAGSWFWGKRSARCGNPLHVYAGLEVGIAVTALLYFAVIKGYHLIYPEVYQSLHSGTWLLFIKFLLALLLIFPPAFCMGGTIPVMGQHAIRIPSRFGSTSALLYGVNILGATLGAFLAGFFMPLWFGFRATCFIAIGITLVTAMLAYLLSRSASASMAVEERGDGKMTTSDPPHGLHRSVLTAVCLLSGFGVLALEVLWTRMFSLVFENSVYTFAAILVVVLSCLAAGSLISSLLARQRWSPNLVLVILLGLSGISIAVTPGVFMDLTNSFEFQSQKMIWTDFVLLIFQKCALTIGPPALLLGTVFPYLMKMEERYTSSPGKSLGRLAMINTIGAILGALLSAFFLLEHFGLWRSMQIIGVIYFLMALCMPSLRSRVGWTVKGLSAAGLALLFTGLDPSHLPPTGRVASNEHEEVLKTWEGGDCTVSVVRNERGLVIKINSDYGLGSTKGWQRQAAQAEIPLMLRPGTESVFFLGMGTGISAGAALSDRFPEVKRVVTCELSANVVTAAKEFMTDVDGVDLTNRLFSDPRSTVLVEDGRHYLMATDDTFDLVVGDLFLPYQSSAGSLYTREHFASVKDRLNPDGLFVQWIPAYQVTGFEFHVIGRTMLEVFDQVSLWRGDFAPFNEVVAFVGHKSGEPLPASDLDATDAKMGFLAGDAHGDMRQALNPQTALVYYAGNVSASAALFADYPVNTDDRPVIQYMAPRQYRDKGEKEMPWFVGPYLLKWIKQVQEACPPNRDPLLAHRNESNRRLPLAGSAYHEMSLWFHVGNEEQVDKNWQRFIDEWLDR